MSFRKLLFISLSLSVYSGYSQVKKTPTPIQDCEAVKKELQLYKDKFGSLTAEPVTEVQNPLTIVNNLDSDIEFKFLGIEGDKATQMIKVSFTLFTKKVHQNVKLWANQGSTGETRATDKEGNQYLPKGVGLGAEKYDEHIWITTKLPTEIKLKGYITFVNVLRTVKELSQISIHLENENFDGGKEAHSGTIDIKNATIVWK